MKTYKYLVKCAVVLIFAGSSLPCAGDDIAGANYVRHKVYVTGGSAAGDGMYRSETSYYDGLGRGIQTVLGSALPVDGVMAGYTEYDGAGRAFREWLPASLVSAPGDAPIGLGALQQSYGSLYGGDARPYSETRYDGSPLGRIRGSAGAGEAWHASEKEVRKRYLTTDPGKDTLRCRIFTAEPSPADTSLTLRRGGWWPAGSLTVEETTDEDGRKAYVFTDLFGRTVLERSLNAGASATQRFVDTYYVYDAGGRLLAVLPPMLSAAKSTGSTSAQWSSLTDADLRKWSYLYLYDGRGRLRAKRLPGCGWTEYGYDLGDEAVWSRDPLQRARGEYLFTLRDGRGRECVTGVCGGLEIASGKYARARRAYPGMSPSDTALLGYRAEGVTLTGVKVLTVNYYDDYSFLDAVPSDSLSRPLSSDGAYVEDAECGTRYAVSADGLLTGHLSRILDLPDGDGMTVYAGQGAPFLWQVNYYDAKGRAVQTRRSTHRGTLETEGTAYDFTGNVLLRKLHHGLGWNAGPDTPDTERYSYAYDGWGRLTETWHQWGSGTPKRLSARSYDGIGRLSGESRGSGAGQVSMSYAYNVRGHLTGKTVTGGSGAGVTGSNIFSEQLFYEQTDPLVQNAPRWGGDVSGMMWVTGTGEEAGEPVPHRYAFGYDGLGRLTRASYRGPEGRYGRETEYGYDRNGNVTQLIRNERNAADSLVSRRNLTLTYNGNRLTEVNAGTRLTPSEANPVTPPTGPLTPSPNPEVGPVVPGVGVEEPIVSVALPQLAYYPDGSLKYDDYGEIVNIEYNAVKLPSKVDRGLRVLPEGMAVAPQMDEIQSVLYGYSADGFKLRREERNANPDMTAYPVGHFTTDYVGNCIWRGETLATVLTEGGYIDASDGSYHFFVTDHLGNIRAITDESGTIEKSFDYYPFGESYASATVSNPGEAFRYGGKEREEKFGVHEVYDFSARWYSPVYGRFQTMDPLCEKYYSLSPYAYCANNPMRFVDPSGMWEWDATGNLRWQQYDNIQTLADFLEIPFVDARAIVFRNTPDFSGMNDGYIIKRENLWTEYREEKKNVVSNTLQAVWHYYFGKGAVADVGDKSTEELINSPEFQSELESIRGHVNNGKVEVDMTKRTYHIGNTTVLYDIEEMHNGRRAVFRMFGIDSFSDPIYSIDTKRGDQWADGLDPHYELGGDPYHYGMRTRTYYFGF